MIHPQAQLSAYISLMPSGEAEKGDPFASLPPIKAKLTQLPKVQPEIRRLLLGATIKYLQVDPPSPGKFLARPPFYIAHGHRDSLPIELIGKKRSTTVGSPLTWSRDGRESSDWPQSELVIYHQKQKVHTQKVTQAPELVGSEEIDQDPKRPKTLLPNRVAAELGSEPFPVLRSPATSLTVRWVKWTPPRNIKKLKS